MSRKELRIKDLVAKVPIVQGGMGVGISLSSLAGAVAACGGIGVISTAQIGFKEPDFDEHPLEANMRAIGKHIKKAREIAPDGVIGVNIMVATKNYEMYVKEAVKNGIDLIISGAGLPLDLPELVKGSNTKIAPIVSSKKAASIIFRMWKKKYNVLPDAVVIEGPKAGGHLGFHYDQLEDIEGLHYDDEITSIITYVKEEAKKGEVEIPVIVAGGISSKEDVEHCFSLGADGVQVATRFVTTEECDADIRYKEAYINCKKEDIEIVKSPVGMPGRAIHNKFIDRVKADRIPIKKCRGCITPCNPATTPYCITDALINGALGNLDDALLFCGADAYKETRISTVKEVIDELMED